MPDKPERSCRKFSASKQLWEIWPAKQANQDVSLAEPGVSNADCNCKKCGKVENDRHKQLSVTSET